MTLTSRAVLVALGLLALTGCGGLVDVMGSDIGPEQSEFVVVPGGGPGPHAESLATEQVVSDSDMRLVEGSASHVASISTPAGTLERFTFDASSTTSGPISCDALMGPTGGSMGCGPRGEFGEPEPVDAMMISGSGSTDEWSETTVSVRDEVASIVATAADGTVYRLTPGAGFAYVMWPSERGDLQLEAFDENGSSLGTASSDAIGP